MSFPIFSFNKTNGPSESSAKTSITGIAINSLRFVITSFPLLTPSALSASSYISREVLIISLFISRLDFILLIMSSVNIFAFSALLFALLSSVSNKSIIFAINLCYSLLKYTLNVLFGSFLET